MMNALLITFVSGNLDKYRPESSKELTSFYSLNVAGFTPNRGQIVTDNGKEAKEVIFYTRNKNLNAYITQRGVSYVIYDEDNFSRVDYELIGVKIERSRVEYYDELPGYENYYLAHCPDGILFVKSYRKVVIKDVYNNIDWVFRYDEFGNLHHEFILKKGGELADIRIKIRNANIEIKDKEIEMKTSIGSIIDGKLVAYEDTKKVEVSYKFEKDEIGFIVNGYSRNGNLVIDPQLVWATYYGGEDIDYVSHVSTDNSNNLYIVGEVFPSNFPTYNPRGGAYFQNRGGGRDAFILKFNSDGVRLWATYYGGDDIDDASSVSIDNNNNVYVVGHTRSFDFPIYDPEIGAYFQGSNAGYHDAFILKFNSNGVRLWATYYGGSDNDMASSVSIDNNNNVYVVGNTRSTNFPTQNLGGGAYFQGKKIDIDEVTYDIENPAIHIDDSDIFILKFDSDGVRQWATYYGGKGDDKPSSISIDKDNNLYIVGTTSSDDFPIYNLGKEAYLQGSLAGYEDIFIIKFKSNGKILWSTYYGGDSTDYANSVFIDNNNNIYIVGTTTSTDFPVYNPGGNVYFQKSNAGKEDAFILKFNSNGIRLWATYYGGRENDGAYSVSVDNNNNIYVVGKSSSTDFPLYNPGEGSYFQESKAYLGEYSEYSDAFIIKFNSNGVRQWATCYGGNDSDYASSVSIDSDNNIYVAGSTSSTDLTVYNPGGAYIQKRNAGMSDVFIIKFKSERLKR